MNTIKNKWIEKQKKKKVAETAPSYESTPQSERDPLNMKRPEKRSTMASRSMLVKTLRGIRK